MRIFGLLATANGTARDRHRFLRQSILYEYGGGPEIPIFRVRHEDYLMADLEPFCLTIDCESTTSTVHSFGLIVSPSMTIRVLHAYLHRHLEVNPIHKLELSCSGSPPLELTDETLASKGICTTYASIQVKVDTTCAFIPEQSLSPSPKNPAIDLYRSLEEDGFEIIQPEKDNAKAKAKAKAKNKAKAKYQEKEDRRDKESDWDEKKTQKFSMPNSQQTNNPNNSMYDNRNGGNLTEEEALERALKLSSQEAAAATARKQPAAPPFNATEEHKPAPTSTGPSAVPTQQTASIHRFSVQSSLNPAELEAKFVRHYQRAQGVWGSGKLPVPRKGLHEIHDALAALLASTSLDHP
jgi:hypothetical protein